MRYKLVIGITAISLFFNYIVKGLIGVDAYFHAILARSILENGFHIPPNIGILWTNTYFGYAPLAHYILAGITTISHIPLLTVMKYYPSIMLGAIISVSSLYLKRRSFSLVIFAASPLLFEIVFMAGSYGRITALFFMLLMLIFVEKSIKHTSWKYLIITGIFFGLVILSHILAAIVSGAVLAYILFLDLIKKRDFRFIVPIIIGLIVSSPWLIFIISNFGPIYLIQIFFVTKLKRFGILTLGLIMIFLMLSLFKKRIPKYTDIILLMSMAISSIDIMTIPLALYFKKIKVKKIHLIGAFLVFFIYFQVFIVSPLFPKMDKDKYEAVDWINENTNPEDSFFVFREQRFIRPENIPEFLVNEVIGPNLNGAVFVSHSYLPALTNRRTYTWIGYVWSLDPERIEIYNDLSSEFCSDEFREKTNEYNLNIDYVLLEKYSQHRKHIASYCDDFSNIVFENEGIKIIRI